MLQRCVAATENEACNGAAPNGAQISAWDSTTRPLMLLVKCLQATPHLSLSLSLSISLSLSLSLYVAVVDRGPFHVNHATYIHAHKPHEGCSGN